MYMFIVVYVLRLYNTQIKKRLRQQVRILKRKIKKFSDETKKARELELKKKLKELNQKIPVKYGRLKRVSRQDQTI